MTDGLPSYRGIANKRTKHETVDPFGLFKRSLIGSFHQVSVKHLDRYLDELEFREQ